jgi:hypothetical protein
VGERGEDVATCMEKAGGGGSEGGRSYGGGGGYIV